MDEFEIHMKEDKPDIKGVDVFLCPETPHG